MPTLQTYNEQKLFLGISEGDEAAFTTFFLQKVAILKPAIDKLTRLESNTEEIIQETFIKVWLNRDKLPSIENLNGYIYKIAFHEYHIYLRKEAAIHKREAKWQHNCQNEDKSLLHQLKATELKEMIHQCVEQLPTQRKLIYTMSRNEGKTNTEIAQILNISPQTVKNAGQSLLNHHYFFSVFPIKGCFHSFSPHRAFFCFIAFQQS